MSKIGERSQQSVTVTNGTSTSGTIDLRGFNTGAFCTPATFELTTVKFQGAAGPGDTFKDIEDAAGALVTNASVSTSLCETFPAQVFAYPFIKIVGTVGGPVAADRTLIIFLAAV